MDPKSDQWITMGPSASPQEEQALRTVRSLLNDHPTTWAWANLSFVSPDQRGSEVDVILLHRTGLYVIELKGYHGTISGDQQMWRLTGPEGQVRTERNPRLSTRTKAQRLRSLLEQGYRGRIPYVHEIVVLHGEGSTVKLDDLAKSGVYGLDGYDVCGVPPFTELLKKRHDEIDKPTAAAVVKRMGQVGLKPRPKTRVVGDYTLDDAEPLAEGVGWVDHLATHAALKRKVRIRLYDVAPDISQTQRAELVRAARREVLLTQDLRHPGVVSALDYTDTERGPALIFPADQNTEPLLQYLGEHRDHLTLDDRLGLVRGVAEVLSYAHRNRVYHRALTPDSVSIRPEQPPQVTVRDWQTGQQDLSASASATRHATLAGATGLADLVVQDQYIYLAPEALHGTRPDPVALDVYGLGVLAYIILTGQPPVATMVDLQEQVGGFDPSVVMDGLPAELTDLVVKATDPDASKRLLDVAAFLAALTEIEKGLAESAADDFTDPLEAGPLSILEEGLIVEERLGTGATGIALLVSSGEADSVPTVLKVARDATREDRLRNEAEVLARLDHPRIVQLIAQPRTVGGRLCIEVADAGRPTLGSRIVNEGRLTIEQLQNYGRDLFSAVSYLESQGVMHRDIKPDNLGVRADASDRKPRLVLFDFSLANEALEHVQSGTRGYLDPFLGSGSRQRYDSAAERFAVAVTLFQMATGQMPEWGDGQVHPAAIADEVSLVPDWFEDQVSEPLMAFFAKALARDASNRFDTLEDMATAWDRVYAGLTAPSTTSVQGDPDALAAAAELTTTLSAAGLSPRAQSAASRLGAVTVGELIAVPAITINQLSGVGVEVRRELQQRCRQWRGLLTVHEEAEDPQGRGVERLLSHLSPGSNGRNAETVALGRAFVERPELDAWPTWAAIAEKADVADYVEPLGQLVRRWVREDAVTVLRLEVQEVLAQFGGVATADEVARRILALHGSRAEGDERLFNAVGLVRATVEADSADGGQISVARDAGDQAILLTSGEDSDPRVAAIRDLARVVEEALEAADGPIPPIAALSLVADHPIAEAVGVADPGRLLSVVAATSPNGAVSGRGELYSRGMPAKDSVRVVVSGQAGHAVLSESWLRRAVLARFPEASPLPERPDLDALVEKAQPDFKWDGRNYTRQSGGSTSLIPSHTRLMTIPGAPARSFDAVDARLRESLTARSAVVLAADPRRIGDAPAALVARFGVTEFNVTSALLEGMREVASDKGIAWGFLLRVDAKDPASSDRAKLAELAELALQHVWPPVAQSPHPLLLTNVDVLARYGLLGRVETLLDLATARPAARWILVPFHSSQSAPMFDDEPVPLPPDGWVPLPGQLFEEQVAG